MAAKPSSPQKIGFWTMVRDVLIASMNKGQFPLALFGIILLTMIIRMPPADVSRLAFQVLDDLKGGYLFGYAGSLLVTGGWFVHARFQRRIINNEMTRIADERDALQKQLGSPVKPSGGGGKKR